MVIAKRWKQHKCPSMDEQINKMYIHTMEYYSAWKKRTPIICYNNMNKSSGHYAISKITQSKKFFKYHMVPLMCETKAVKFIRKVEWWLLGLRGKEKGSYLVDGVSNCKRIKFWRSASQQCGYNYYYRNVHF